ncbi:hypothetical protein GGR52DRAFT_220627 [Hypoxylon sp. FL1284]|nr:hypothetical protein GGR52DRAFT_220627 [Hypoxylon sp. FL1284]
MSVNMTRALCYKAARLRLVGIRARSVESSDTRGGMVVSYVCHLVCMYIVCCASNSCVNDAYSELIWRSSADLHMSKQTLDHSRASNLNGRDGLSARYRTRTGISEAFGSPISVGSKINLQPSQTLCQTVLLHRRAKTWDWGLPNRQTGDYGVRTYSEIYRAL